MTNHNQVIVMLNELFVVKLTGHIKMSKVDDSSDTDF